MREVALENGFIANSIIPSLFQDYGRYEKKVEKRINRCRRALKMNTPKMSVYNYDVIKYRLNYKIDHDKLKESEYEDAFIRELCQGALCDWYLKSCFGKIISFFNKYFFV